MRLIDADELIQKAMGIIQDKKDMKVLGIVNAIMTAPTVDSELVRKEMIYSSKPQMEVLDTDCYRGFLYAIVSLGTHPCAYIQLQKGHRYYGWRYDKIPVDCHGGLTYAEDSLAALPEVPGWWIGWDYAHAGDYCGLMAGTDKKWTVSEVFEEVKQVADQLETNVDGYGVEEFCTSYLGTVNYEFFEGIRRLVIAGGEPTAEWEGGNTR